MKTDQKFLSSFEARLKETASETNISGRISPPSVDDLMGMLQLQQTDFFKTSYPPAPVQDSDLDFLLEKVAFMGKFLPGDLIGGAAKDDQSPLLNELSLNCSVDTLDQRYWVLKPDVRSALLERLHRSGRLDAGASVHFSEPNDKFGKMLREIILSPWDIQLYNMQRSELQLLLEVLEAIITVNIEKPELEEVKARLRTAALLDNYRHLIDRFVGRAKELKRLEDFFEKRDYRMRRCLLTGSGGSGKSTVITRFVKDLLDYRQALVVILDFDRPGMSSADSSWLSGEVSRQIGMQLQDQSRRLGTTRGFNTFEKENFNLYHSDSLEREESLRIDRYQQADLASVIAGSYLPLVLILDTIEEVVEQGGFSNLTRWLSELESIASEGLSLVFSGRVPNKYILFPRGIDEIPIPEFDQRTAKIFLEKHGLDKTLSARIARSKKVPRRPLELKMLAQLLEREDITFEEIENELDNNVKLSKGRDLFVSLIYRRVLQRIKKENVRKIAYPGLILRFVNADLVGEVLQPLLELGEMSAAECAVIVDDLAGYAWLAYRDGKGNVWHQQELRRTMLNLMHRKDPELAESIHLAAIAYFSSLATPEAKAEVVYHRLMRVNTLQDAEMVNMNELKKAAPLISVSAADLSSHATVLLKYAQTGKVSVADLALFPDRYISRIYDRMGRQMVSKALYEEAFQWYKRAAGLRLKVPIESRWQYGQWEQDMLFNLAEFREIPKLQLYQQAPYGSSNAFLNYSWPAALIGLRDIDRQVLEQKAIADSFSKSKGREDAQLTVLTQFTYACVLIGKREFNRASLNAYLSDWNRRYRYSNSSHYARNQLFLLLLQDKRPDAEFEIPPTHFRLNAEWFSELVRLTGAANDAPFRSLTIIKQAETINLNVRTLLAAIDKDYTQSSSGSEVIIKVKDMPLGRLGTLVRGSDAMFRQPCKAAIQAALAEGMPYEILRQAFAGSINIRLAELQPGEFEEAFEKDPDIVVPLIEMVDRSWALAHFLNSLTQAWTGTEKLERLREVYRRLDDAINLLFTK